MEDRRVRRTKRQLREELIALLRVKDIREITVKELTERAMAEAACIIIQ